ncbi:toprim domain-containing protein [Salinispora tropica]|uniref:Toprim domain-containing protein n=1 Tax=Salinispora tropica (strain ATCC BAA-916 / DSM 44818 / JCM 13857 / NBRC 105044 / CNB-440) TaxID=369723 RepID=A4X2A3_SALTO|nr:toprim domain-containing protein [Salinispora tropica]ABP53003.1 hypothetical protein Strop_0519 [Salinispora tropica CNB-440]
MTERDPLRPLSVSQRETLEEATAAYQSQLTADVAGYLTARGIGQDLADAHRLGAVVEPMPGHKRFQGMLAIPYLDKDGLPLSMRFRCIEAHEHRDYHHGKYNSMTDESTRMFNIGAIHRDGSEIHLAEGEFDTILLDLVFSGAVGVAGARAFLPRHRRMLAGFSRIWVWADPDDAGTELANTVTRGLRGARVVRLRGGDVTDIYMAGGAPSLHSLIDAEGGNR